MRTFENISMYMKQLISSSSKEINGDDMCRMMNALLRGFGYHKDNISQQRRKLKSGRYVYYIELRDDGELITIDPALERGWVSGSHPLTDEFKGRGRNPIEKPEEETDTISVAALLRAITMSPKTMVSRNADAPAKFCVFLKDIRRQLKSYGVNASYAQLESMVDEMEELEIGSSATKSFELSAGMTVEDWALNRVSVVDFIESLERKYLHQKE